MLQIQSPFQQFFNKSGSPLDGGSVYVGTANLNPETNPLVLYWDDAGTQPVAQPIKTLGGYLVRNGTPARVYTTQTDFSLTVKDNRGAMVFSVLSATSLANLQNELASSSGASMIGFVQSGTGAVLTNLQIESRRWVFAEQFGAIGNESTDCTNAVWKAIESVRGNAKTIIDTIGGNNITAYSSGTVHFGPGIFVVSADAFKIYQDMGLTLKGMGSRRTTNAQHGATTLVVKGVSSGFIIQTYRGGGRGITIEDMDICYDTASFTGDVFDTIDAPGPTLNRVFLGTFGTSGGTRLQTARSCLRATYDEFITLNNVVMDGAVDGVWFDDIRTELANPFGGFGTTMNQCVFYDFTSNMVRCDGNRTRDNLQINLAAFNPISVDCTRSVSLNNVEGLQINGGVFTPSVANKASIEWIRLVNCTGHLKSASFNDLAKAGTLNGMLEVSGNRVYCTDGFFLTGGVITGRNNEFSKGTNGFVLTPTQELCVDLGPDLFKPTVTSSYYVPTDSVNLSGRINYDLATDDSASKFSNASDRICVENIDKKAVTNTLATSTLSIYDSGRTVLAAGSVDQVFTLPLPSPGVTLRVSKIVGQALTIQKTTGSSIYMGTGAAKSALSSLAADIGGHVELKAIGTTGWLVTSLVGVWTWI